MGIPAAVKFATQTANGSSASIAWPGGRGVFSAWGTWGSGTLTLQQSPDDGTTWINVDRTGDTYVTFTGNGEGGFELGECLLRVTTTGSTTPSIQSGVQTAGKSAAR
jgi:hypothetical protein